MLCAQQTSETQAAPWASSYAEIAWTSRLKGGQCGSERWPPPRAAVIWGHCPKRDFTWGQESEAQPPVLEACHLRCFLARLGLGA